MTRGGSRGGSAQLPGVLDGPEPHCGTQQGADGPPWEKGPPRLLRPQLSRLQLPVQNLPCFSRSMW